ncbi:hypothetical protein BJ138DRAFT_110749 [Hygrophoropsis aurantiaca]|uniref:Uncharacterized protein n=1 Tax=Hygrophoropsis aurantiaca TaxID=72124 RepID=A0ACB8AAR3_9AGAM|nr:hypothetical protein BJ138DRAFT_110749 [Hygrophoropsis aurantiaca]
MKRRWMTSALLTMSAAGTVSVNPKARTRTRSVVIASYVSVAREHINLVNAQDIRIFQPLLPFRSGASIHFSIGEM